LVHLGIHVTVIPAQDDNQLGAHGRQIASLCYWPSAAHGRSSTNALNPDVSLLFATAHASSDTRFAKRRRESFSGDFWGGATWSRQLEMGNVTAGQLDLPTPSRSSGATHQPSPLLCWRRQHTGCRFSCSSSPRGVRHGGCLLVFQDLPGAKVVLDILTLRPSFFLPNGIRQLSHLLFCSHDQLPL